MMSFVCRDVILCSWRDVKFHSLMNWLQLQQWTDYSYNNELTTVTTMKWLQLQQRLTVTPAVNEAPYSEDEVQM